MMVGMVAQMPKKAAGLTARRVETERVPGLYADGNGLYLKVAPSRAKTWVFRYQIAGRRRDMGLGPVNVYSLKEARERGRDARRSASPSPIRRAPMPMR